MSPRAMGRVRGLAVAAGVPLAFALLALLLTVGGTGSPAGAAEPAGAAASAPAQPWSVRRDLVRGYAQPMTITSRAHTSDPVVFLTIDDGVHKNRRALRFVEDHQLPITAFVSTWTIKDSAPYFARITRWGSIQNHTATHAPLSDSATDLDHEICQSQETFARDFGTTPWLLRPPYGVGADRLEVQVEARRCGITRLVLWNAVVDKGTLSVPGGRLRPGDIVLLHFTKGLAKDLKVAVAAARKAGLAPASLAAYLPDNRTASASDTP